MDYIFYMSTLCAMENEVSKSQEDSVAMEAGLFGKIKTAVVSFFKMLGGLFRKASSSLATAISRIKSKIGRKGKQSSEAQKPTVEVKSEDEAQAKIAELEEREKKYQDQIKGLQTKLGEMQQSEEDRMAEVKKKYSESLGKYERDLETTRQQRNAYKDALLVLRSSSKVTAANKDELNGMLTILMNKGSTLVSNLLRSANTASNARTMEAVIKTYATKHMTMPLDKEVDTFLDAAEEYAYERKRIGATDDKDIKKLDFDVIQFLNESRTKIESCASSFEKASKILAQIPDSPDINVQQEDFDQATKNMQAFQNYTTKMLASYVKAMSEIVASYQ